MIDPENSYSVPECMNDIYDYVWNPTIKGGKLTEGQMMLQREYLKQVCSGAGLSYTGNGAAAERGLSDRNIAALEVPELIGGLDLINKNLCYDPDCQEHKSIASPVAGYSDPYIYFSAPKMYEAKYYSYLLKARALLKSKVMVATGDVKGHYTLLLRNIEKTLK